MRVRPVTAAADPPMARGTAVHLRGVTKSYRQGDVAVPVLRGVDLHVDEGQFVALVGASGSGKSTVLNLAGGLDTADSGTVEVAGEDVTALDADGRAALRRNHVGFVFQLFHLIPSLSVAENVGLPLAAGRVPDAARRVDEMLQVVGLAHRADHMPNQLSGGEMQRTAIARALAIEPVVILADEPTGSLDAPSGAQVLELIERAVGIGTSVLMVTHDPAVAARADRVVRIEDGRIV